MTEPTSLPKAKPARPLNRWGLGTLSVLQIVFLAALLLALNYLASTYFTRVDLSREGNYTLSPATKRYLQDPAVKDRGKSMKWIMAFRRTSPFYERVRAVAEEYARLSNGRIELEVIDPLRSADRTQEVIAAYGLPFTRDLFIMDARADDRPVSSLDAKGNNILNPNVKVIVAEDMAVYTTDGQRRITGFQGEDVLTARLVESIEGRTRKMLFVTDKSQLDADDGESPLKSLQNTLLFQNVELLGINLSGLKEVPAGTEGIVIVAPKYDLTDEEIAVLEKYWNSPRAALLVMLKAGDAPPKLRTFLRNYGVTPRRDRVISLTEDQRIDTTARGTFTRGIEFTQDLAGQTTVFEGASSSLEVREGAEDLMNRQINPVGLIEAAPEFWGETRFGEKIVTFDMTEDNKPPLFLAASVTRGAASDDRFAADTSRMVVISNTDFLNPKQQRAENIDFLASSANWLMDRQSLAGIGPRSLGTYKLPLLDAQVSFINRANLFFLPGFLILTGAFIWSSRRV